jgi:hypothetical protein
MKFIDDYQVPYDAEHFKRIIPPSEQFDKAIEAFNIMAERIREQIIPTIRKIIEAVAPILNLITEALKTYPNKRIVYLATHGKERVRKKNLKRIMKWLERGCKQ